ncbi:2-oxoglutarate dehydrogenase complex E2 component [Lobulomyces angularis]|nr:2-oxoglutarate dehydrogenase complex E2 component [Lobulomyces angularis]
MTIEKKELTITEDLKLQTASPTGTAFNIMKTMIGAGIFASAAAVGSSGFYFGLFLIVIMGAVFYWTIMTMVRASVDSETKNIQDLMKFSFGKPGELFLNITFLLLAMGSILAYTVILADILPDIMRTLLPSAKDSLLLSRRALIIIVSVGLLFPVSLSRSMAGLAKFSGVAMFMVFFIIMATLFTSVPTSFKGAEEVTFVKIAGIPSAIGSFSFAYVCHHNLLMNYHEMKNKNLKTFSRVTKVSLLIAVVLTIGVALQYLTFREKSESNIINAFPADNVIIIICRVLFAIDMMFTYPIGFVVTRDTINKLFFKNKAFNLYRHIFLSALILAITVTVGCVTCDLGLIIDITGGVTASIVAFIIPSACFLKVKKIKKVKSSLFQKIVHITCIIFGCLLIILTLLLIIQSAVKAEKVIKTPAMADSITEGTLSKWTKSVGDFVKRDEHIATVETDKIDVTVNSPDSGKILELLASEGDTVVVGADLFKLDTDAVDSGKPSSQPATPKEEPAKPSAPPAESKPTPKLSPKPIPKQQKPTPTLSKSPPPPSTAQTPSSSPPPAAKTSHSVPLEGEIPGLNFGTRTERRVKMSRMRLKISERLKDSQNTAAALTTFNEIDMSNIIEMRSKYKDLVLEKENVKLGFMSPFIKAVSEALKQVPEVNARIEGNEVVYSDFVDISVAVATPKGLVTPVLRNCENLSLIEIEKAMAALAKKAKNNAITIEDMAGGTFTISNGGVFGSMMGTPIINQPQAAILGMHATKERAVVVNGQIVIRPMMYVALTYDHRLIDGREATTFLVRVKQLLEDPRRILLGV